MKSILICTFAFTLGLAVLASAYVEEKPGSHNQEDYQALRKEGEKLYGMGSYALAHKIYVKAGALDLSPEDARWVDFRVADTLWRSQAGSQTADTTKYEQARKQLVALVRDVEREEDRDITWVEVQESLGDYWWSRRDSRNWGQAWPYYNRALDWWAASDEIETARERYIGMVWRMARPRDAQAHYYYGYHGNVVPLPILENVLKIARAGNDRARAHYLIAMSVRYRGGDWAQMKRVPEEFEAAIKPGKATEWHDDALFHFAEWMANQGRVIPMEGGQWTTRPDYVRAVKIYRRILEEYRKGETRYHDQARARIKNITNPVVSVGVSNFFLPKSEIQYYLSWRNVKRVDLSITPIDLKEDVRFSGKKSRGGQWLHEIDLAGREKVASWSFETHDKGEHQPGQEVLKLERPLPPGAYVLEAIGETQKARDLILITDAAVVVKTAREQAVVYVCNVIDGSPIPGAEVRLWQRSYDGSDWSWTDRRKTADDSGLAPFDLAENKQGQASMELFVTVAAKDRQAFSAAGNYFWGRGSQQWRIYAFTDRPAYRPGESAHWKLVARRYDGSVYSTPGGEKVLYEITDPQGAKIDEGEATLNAFGSAWSSLELTEAMPLGEYRASFFTAGRKDHIGAATLFRLEEYKLPEFKVAITTPEVDGRRKAFKVGDKVEVSIEAEYYFGGPVANATVEALVYQNPFYHWWSPPRDFPWFYEDMTPSRHHYRGGGQIIKRETLRTDAMGRAKLSFDTPAGSQQDFQYRIEARVTDASRREIVASDIVRVTRQLTYVYLKPDHNLYRPQDKVTIDIKALDANKQPVEVSGQVTVTRDTWYEIWLDPDGKEFKGEELEKIRSEMDIFPPPPPRSGRPGWQLKFRGYEHDKIIQRIVKTNAEGVGELTFVPEREGYYRVAWDSKDRDGAPITAQTTVWVATGATRHLGYHQGGVQIIIDKDTFKVGQKTPVMLSVPTSDRYVLFSVEGEDLYSYRLVHVEGTVKLIQMDIEQEHVPNVYLGAVMVSDRQMYVDTRQVVVPPVKQFLQVEISYDQEVYQPQDKGTITILTKNHEGKPVSAEVALGLVDESVYYIQQDYAGDPRKTFYGQKRPQMIRTNSTFQQKRFTKLAIGDDDKLIEVAWDQDGSEAYLGGVGGGGVGYKKEARLRSAARAPAKSGRDMANAPGAAMAEGAVMYEAEEEMDDLAGRPDESQPGSEAGEPAVQVRRDFRSTVIWQPEVVTDEDGRATVGVKFPDSLTGWKATARVLTQQNHFGIETANTRTRKPLIARLQAPRFFVVGDTATISAVINNNTDEPMTVTPALKSEGLEITGIVVDGQARKGEHGPVQVPPNGESRLDWVVSVLKPGSAKLTVVADGGDHADAMEKLYVVHEHGIEKFVTKAVKLRGEDVTVRLNIPKERKQESTVLTVQVAPSLAVTMLDALPYLVDYPYGCTEQTMSRFLPTAITAKTLKDLGVEPGSVMHKVFGGIEQEHTGKTQRKDKQNLKKLDDMVAKGLARLYDFQHGDGGWGWWKGGESDHFMTAYVVWGLSLAREAGMDVRNDVLDRGARYLDLEIVEEEEALDMQAWMLHALASYHRVRDDKVFSDFQKKAFDNLWKGKARLNAYTRALLALSAHHLGDRDRAKTLISNLENGVKIDKTPDTSVIQRGKQEAQEGVEGTAHWGEDGLYWRWSQGGVEATSFVLQALLTVDPKNALIEPVTNWLIKNRRGAQWSNTRDTAITILALNQYLRQSGELKADLEYELLVNGQSVQKRKLTQEDALSAPSRFSIARDLIRDGTNEIRIVRKGGEGAIYFSAEARYFSLEEPVTPAGSEIFARRSYYKLVGRPTLLKGYVYHKEPLEDGETVMSGTRVEAVITIEGKNNYEYLVFEDLKPAGLEAVQIKSGEPLYARELKSGAVDTHFGREDDKSPKMEGVDYTGRSRWVYQELRDRKVALFIDKLPEGVWEIRYAMRAEVPGTFHALPIMGHAMYVPEIRCNGAEARLTVADKRESSW